MIAPKYQIWVDGEPTKALSDSFDIIKTLGRKSLSDTNRVEIRVTNGPVEVWALDRSQDDWVKTR
jgi:hypothetical protein